MVDDKNKKGTKAKERQVALTLALLSGGNRHGEEADQ